MKDGDSSMLQWMGLGFLLVAASVLARLWFLSREEEETAPVERARRRRIAQRRVKAIRIRV